MYRFELIDFKHQKEIEKYRQEMMNSGSSWDGCSRLANISDSEKYVLDCKMMEKVETCPPNFSIGFQYCYLDDNDHIVGMLNCRPDALHHPVLKVWGGHIGYSVLPSERRKGIGKRMLKQFLPICKKTYSLNKILITCYKENEASRRIIVENGGVYENDTHEGNNIVERYWIEL